MSNKYTSKQVSGQFSFVVSEEESTKKIKKHFIYNPKKYEAKKQGPEVKNNQYKVGNIIKFIT